jgi:hypothetical protein
MVRVEYPEPDDAIHWTTDRWRDGDRDWVEVRNDGWVVATWYVKGDRAFVALKPQETIPDRVLADLPKVIRALTK